MVANSSVWLDPCSCFLSAIFCESSPHPILSPSVPILTSLDTTTTSCVCRRLLRRFALLLGPHLPSCCLTLSRSTGWLTAKDPSALSLSDGVTLCRHRSISVRKASFSLCSRPTCSLHSSHVRLNCVAIWTDSCARLLNAVATSMASGRAASGDDIGSADLGTKLLTSPRSCCFQCYIW